MSLEFDKNDCIKFSDNESKFILTIAKAYCLCVHDLILLSILSLNKDSIPANTIETYDKNNPLETIN